MYPSICPRSVYHEKHHLDSHQTSSNQWHHHLVFIKVQTINNNNQAFVMTLCIFVTHRWVTLVIRVPISWIINKHISHWSFTYLMTLCIFVIHRWLTLNVRVLIKYWIFYKVYFASLLSRLIMQSTPLKSIYTSLDWRFKSYDCQQVG